MNVNLSNIFKLSESEIFKQTIKFIYLRNVSAPSTFKCADKAKKNKQYNKVYSPLQAIEF